MDQPEHDLRAIGPAQATPRRFMSVIVVGALHVLLIWALATGLASQFFQRPPDVLNTEVIKEKPPEQNKVPPPPPPEMVKPPPPFVPPPDIDVQVASTNTNTITTTTTKPVAPPPPAPAPTQLKAIGRTHTIPPYPLLAQRLSQQGTVTLKVTIGTDGNVTEAVIQTSSGVDTLDQAAVEWVKSHWRWEPPTTNGQPSEASTLVRVTFNLRDAH